MAAFYDCFENKDTCTFAGYGFIEVLLVRMTAVDGDDLQVWLADLFRQR